VFLTVFRFRAVREPPPFTVTYYAIDMLLNPVKFARNSDNISSLLSMNYDFLTCYFCQVELRQKTVEKGHFFKQHGCVFMQVKTGYESGKYAFIIMGNRRRVWDNKNAHVCPETAHSAIIA
jgi:hypothetical protein